MRVLGCALIVALTACFSPDEKDGVVRCGVAPDVCPPGFGCGGDGFCRRDQTATPAACSDGVDNDCDGKIDWPDDPGCAGPEDDDEHGSAECDDGIDNDGDGRSDYHDPRLIMVCGPGDSKCHNPSENRER
jgi:hypothetical protein